MDAVSSDGPVAESATSTFTRSRAAFELKGVMSSLTVLRLRSRDLNLIERQLRAKVMQFPQFFQDAPVVLDLGGLEGGLGGFPLAALVHAFRVSRVVPVGVTNVDEAHKDVVKAAGLGVVSLGTARPAGDPEAPAAEPVAKKPPAAEARARSRPEAPPPPPPPPPPKAAAPAPAPAPATAASRAPGAHRPPVVMRQPIRSGQVVYAEKTDLIVLAAVNPGAQLIADGNIHVYAALRGRALAGAQGYADARIFCQRLEAELIAINGAYVTFDDIPGDRRGKPVQVFLQGGRCVIAPL
jgi:septum site-determining protein MinC